MIKNIVERIDQYRIIARRVQMDDWRVQHYNMERLVKFESLFS